MKLSCLQENLSKGLGIVGRAVATRTTLPITNNVLLSTDESRLKLAATNLEMAISHWIGAKGRGRGFDYRPGPSAHRVRQFPARRGKSGHEISRENAGIKMRPLRSAYQRVLMPQISHPSPKLTKALKPKSLWPP